MEKNILIIEDNEQNIYLITYILENAGYQVSQARDGFEGIECAKTIQPLLILLDIQLPGMDGYTVAKELRKIKSLVDTPIIAVTSYAMAGDKEKCFEAKCTGYIEKPINPKTFMAEVVKYIPSQLSENGDL